MKSSNLLLSCLFLLFTLNLIAQNPWTRLSGDPSENGLNHIQRIPNSENLIAVGEGSTILISEDIGESWQHIFNPANLNNNYICNGTYFIDENIGFLYGNGETILKTLDGGYHWEIKYEGDPDYDYDCINDIVFANESNGFAIANGTQLLKTIDGGESWELLDIGASYGFKHFEFINNEIGFVYGSTATTYKTIDSGESWTLLEQPDELPLASISKLSFVNDSLGFISICNNPIKIYRTEDQGLSWTEVFSDWKVINSNVGEFIFSDDLHGYFTLPTYLGYTLSIVRTNDGGLNWNEEVLDNFGYIHGKAFCKYNAEINLGVGFYGSIIKSNDAGNTWIKKYRKFFSGGIYDIQFLNSEDAYALSNYLISGVTTSYLVKTIDGGVSWEICNNQYISAGAISFLNYEIGFFATYDYSLALYKTEDGGESWEEFLNELDIYPSLMQFIDENNGVLIADDHVLFMSNDGGENWEVSPMSFGIIRDVEYMNLDDIYVLGKNGLYYSIDGGENWDYTELEISGLDLYFFNDEMAFIAGQNSIIKSIDGGNTWSETNIDPEHWIAFKSIYFPSSEIGYAVGEGEYENVYKSTDGGESWNPIESHATSPLNYVYFSNEEEGIITGDLGLIMKTSSGGIVGIEEQAEQVKERFFELYPNPTTDFVQINLRHPLEMNNAKLVLLNSSGKPIRSYELEDSIDAIGISLNNYPKGVYLIQLSDDNGIIAAEKLILQ